MFIQYDSVSELLDDYIKRQLRRDLGGGNSWYNNETPEDTKRLTRNGDTRLVPQAEAMLEKLDTVVETTRLTWDRAPAGAYCVVPDVLAGLPTPMRRRIETSDDRAPISIYVTLACSAGISSDVMQRRGTAILALVLALARVRPIRLYGMAIGDGKGGETVVTARINTAPLDLATACYVLTSTGFVRDLCYNLEEAHNGYTGAWPRAMSYSRPAPYYRGLRERLVPSEDVANTLLIPGAQLGDTVLKDPLRWIQHYVNLFTKGEDGTDADFFAGEMAITRNIRRSLDD